MFRKKITTYLLYPLFVIVLTHLTGCKKNNDKDTLSTSTHQDPILQIPVPNIPSFKPVQLPRTNTEKRQLRTSTQFTELWETIPISYHTILKSGDKIGNQIFGQLVDVRGRVLKNENGKPRISNYPNFSSLISDYKKPLTMLTHFEEVPGAIYQTALSKVPPSWTLIKATATHPISTKDVGGLWLPSSGIFTRWNTHLGLEKFPPDAKTFQQAKSVEELDPALRKMATYFDADLNSIEDIHKKINPYRYGFAFEISLDEQRKTTIQKRYAMGRMSHGSIHIMSFGKTIYLTEDGPNGGLYMFVTAMPNNTSLRDRLSYGGTLYAMKWNQTSDLNGGAANIEWIDLGLTGDEMISGAIESGIQFSDIFETHSPNANETCPEDFRSVHSSYGSECLRLKPRMSIIASRLETNRYAAYMGATTEFQNGNGITASSKDTLYFAIREISRGMEDRGESNRFEKLGPNHIRLPKNPCGAIYEMQVKQDKKIESRFVAKSIKAWISGTPKTYSKGSGLEQNQCDIDNLSNPDNITFSPQHKMLFIAEDSNLQHQTDVAWAVSLTSNRIQRILTTPYGAKVSGLEWQIIGATFYLMSSIQHSFNESDPNKIQNPGELEATVGYIGPFPVLRH